MRSLTLRLPNPKRLEDAKEPPTRTEGGGCFSKGWPERGTKVEGMAWGGRGWVLSAFSFDSGTLAVGSAFLFLFLFPFC
jgi:hypothetical protein